MATATIATSDAAIVLQFGIPLARMSDDDFFNFCQQNGEYRLERTAQGDLIVMTPTGGESGQRNLQLAVQLGSWASRTVLGVGFDSSTGFTLPNGAMRAPDVSWVSNEHWDALSKSERVRFPPLAPDFVVELRSQTDSLESLQAKLREYLENGARLGWLIDPYEKRVEIYRPGESSQTLDQPETLSGDPELPGFVLVMEKLWAE